MYSLSVATLGIAFAARRNGGAREISRRNQKRAEMPEYADWQDQDRLGSTLCGVASRNN
jgi:hypothetical protein